ncbi:serine/arginine repetitive matrix protein 3-like [Passer domesticus]|uniref:serine/arginine repetitive matrix protein 3-like n=1 Tax=Passer domesticus TaxID=48849 RepID=UPI0030FE12C7
MRVAKPDTLFHRDYPIPRGPRECSGGSRTASSGSGDRRATGSRRPPPRASAPRRPAAASEGCRRGRDGCGPPPEGCGHRERRPERWRSGMEVGACWRKCERSPGVRGAEEWRGGRAVLVWGCVCLRVPVRWVPVRAGCATPHGAGCCRCRRRRRRAVTRGHPPGSAALAAAPALPPPRTRSAPPPRPRSPPSASPLRSAARAQRGAPPAAPAVRARATARVRGGRGPAASRARARPCVRVSAGRVWPRVRAPERALCLGAACVRGVPARAPHRAPRRCHPRLRRPGGSAQRPRSGSASSWAATMPGPLLLLSALSSPPFAPLPRKPFLPTRGAAQLGGSVRLELLARCCCRRY